MNKQIHRKMKKNYLFAIAFLLFAKKDYAQVINFTVKDIYDFNVGDTFQYYFRELLPGYNVSYNVNRVITSKTIIADTIIYEYMDTKWNPTPYPPFSPYPVNDISSLENGLHEYQKLKLYNKDSIIYNYNKDWYPPINYRLDTTYLTFDTDLQQDVVISEQQEMNNFWRKYAVGLGEIEYEIFIEGYPIRPTQKLVYFSKTNGQHWGSPLNVGITDPVHTPSFLSPNPATNSLMIDGVQQGEIIFYNAIGQLVFSHTIMNNSTTIDIAHWQRGLYFYKITDHDGVSASGKVIVE